jgi:hypothetical protein
MDSKWGQIRVSGIKKMVSVQIDSVPIFLDGGKIKRCWRKGFKFFRSLPSALKSDLKDFLGSEPFIYFIFLLAGLLGICLLLTVLYFVITFIWKILWGLALYLK